MQQHAMFYVSRINSLGKVDRINFPIAYVIFLRGISMQRVMSLGHTVVAIQLKQSCFFYYKIKGQGQVTSDLTLVHDKSLPKIHWHAKFHVSMILKNNCPDKPLFYLVQKSKSRTRIPNFDLLYTKLPRCISIQHSLPIRHMVKGTLLL